MLPEFVAMAYKHNPTRAFSVDWYIGKRCNFDCSYCVSYLHDHHSAHVPLERMQKLVDLIQARYGANVDWSICGGEPTIVPHLAQILDHIRIQGAHHLSMTTNLSRRADYLIDIFQRLDNITASLHFEYIATEQKRREYLDKIKEVESWRRSFFPAKNFIVRFMMYPGQFAHILAMRDELLSFGLDNLEYRQIRPLLGTANEQMPSRILGFQTNHDELAPESLHGEGQRLDLRRTPMPPIQGATAPDHPTLEPRHGEIVKQVERREDWYSTEEKAQLLELLSKEPKRKLRLWFNTEDGIQSEDYHYNRLNFERRNNFNGWWCWAGAAHMKVAPNGDIFIGSCHVGGRLGNIFNLQDDFSLPSGPVKCPKWRCTDNLDLKVPKLKDFQYLSLLKDYLRPTEDGMTWPISP